MIDISWNSLIFVLIRRYSWKLIKDHIYQKIGEFEMKLQNPLESQKYYIQVLKNLDITDEYFK